MTEVCLSFFGLSIFSLISHINSSSKPRTGLLTDTSNFCTCVTARSGCFFGSGLLCGTKILSSPLIRNDLPRSLSTWMFCSVLTFCYISYLWWLSHSSAWSRNCLCSSTIRVGTPTLLSLDRTHPHALDGSYQHHICADLLLSFLRKRSRHT